MHKLGDYVSVDGDELDNVGHDVHGHLVGMVGRVIFIEFNHSCGANDDGIDGENTDPLYKVGFVNGEVGDFYGEELWPEGYPEDGGGYPCPACRGTGIATDPQTGSDKASCRFCEDEKRQGRVPFDRLEGIMKHVLPTAEALGDMKCLS